MAKVAFSKLKCKINDTEVPIQIGEETVIVKQYLPIQDKLQLIGRVVELAHEEDYNFSNPVKVNVFRNLEILFAYTNISFTDKQKEDLPKLYDMLASSGILKTIIGYIPEEEIKTVENGIAETIEAFYKYQNSVLGLLDTIKTDYNDLGLDIEALTNNLQNLNNLDMVKGLLTNLN